jgi:two-component system NtrC family sensor kinase
MLYLGIGLGYVVVYAAAGWALGGHPFARSVFGNIGLLLPPLAVCAIILRRRRRWAGCHRLFWDTFAISLGLWIVGHLGWAFEQVVLGRQSWLQWHTVFSLCGGIGPLIALFARPHRGVRANAVGSVDLVLASYGLLAVFIYSYFVLVPAVVPAATDPQVTLLRLVQVNRALLFGAMTAVMLVARRTEWRLTYAYLAAGTGIGFFLRIVTSRAILGGRYQLGTLYDLAWILPFLCYAAAALSAPDSPAEAASTEVPERVLPAAVSAVPVFLIPLVGYASLYIQPLGGAGDSFRALLTGLMTVGGVVLLTIRLAAQGGELQRADARMRLLAAATEQTGDLILITRANGAFEHANDAFVRALGYSRDELSALRFTDLIARDAGTLEAHIASEVAGRGIWRGTLMGRRRDGTTFPAACTVVGLRGPTGALTHYVGVERDVSDELRLRDQLVHSERLSAVGELVAGVAHEINNPLQTIVGSIELMMEDRPNPSTRRDLEVVRREAARAGQIVRNLLSFVRRSARDRLAADLNDLVRATVGLRKYHLEQHGIQLATQFYPGALKAIVNREEIQQIVLNLIVNAEQAILSTGRVGSIALRTYPAGAHHVIEVSDDGPGVDADLRGRIFEPFFTTKDVGDGTGLGLSIAHGIAVAHGGSLDLCDSTAGACFRLSLPARLDASLSQPPAVADGDTLRRALVVDDEAAVRTLLVRMLVRRGFEVLAADTGAAALDIASSTSLSLVLCDVRMPEMNGIELYREMCTRYPEPRRTFVFITGDSGSVEVEEGLEDVPLLSKPFTGADLDAVLTRAGIDAAVA